MNEQIDAVKSEKKKIKLQQEIADLKIKEARLAEQEAKTQRAKSRLSEESFQSGGLYGTSSEPRKALSTYLRNQNKLEVSVITILDRKSAILIRICTTLISGLIVFHSYIDENVTNGHTISLILLIGCAITLVISILATKPFGYFFRKIIRTQIKPNHEQPEENIYYMVDGTCSLKEYEDAMSKVVNSQNLQIGNQVRGNYLLAQNNNVKSRLVDLAYDFFLGTFLIASVVFIFGRYF